MKLGLLSSIAVCAGILTACGASPEQASERVASSGERVTVCAGGSTVKGVDVSVYQGTVDWNAAHGAGIDFGIARVSDGTTTPDGTFAGNWSGMKAAGVVRGAYQFFRASEDPTAQANMLVSAIGTLEPGDLPPTADVEVMDGVSGATLVANLATWVSVVKSKTGRTPMIYSAPGFWDALPSTGQFGGEVLWVANWGPACPDLPTPWTAWSFWQYSDSGSVAGISGAVDMDEFNGTLAQLQGLGGPAPYAAQFVGQSFPLAATALTMTAGQTIPSYIELKNTGSKTWDSSTRLGTTQPRDRASAFADGTWVSPNRPAAVQGTVAPGASYKFAFDLHAPSKPGTYLEYFGVVQDGVAWFSDPGQGGPVDNDLEVQVKVVAAPPGQDAGAVPPGDGGTTELPDGAVGGGGDDGGAAPSGPPEVAASDGGAASGATATSPVSSHGGCAMAPGASTSPWAICGIVIGLGITGRRRSRRQTSCQRAPRGL